MINAEVTVQFYPIGNFTILPLGCKFSRSLQLIANNTKHINLLYYINLLYIYIYRFRVTILEFFFFLLHLADSPFLPFYSISLSLAFSAYLSLYYV